MPLIDTARRRRRRSGRPPSCRRLAAGQERSLDTLDVRLATRSSCCCWPRSPRSPPRRRRGQWGRRCQPPPAPACMLALGTTSHDGHTSPSGHSRTWRQRAVLEAADSALTRSSASRSSARTALTSCCCSSRCPRDLPVLVGCALHPGKGGRRRRRPLRRLRRLAPRRAQRVLGRCEARGELRELRRGAAPGEVAFCTRVASALCSSIFSACVTESLLSSCRRSSDKWPSICAESRRRPPVRSAHWCRLRASAFAVRALVLHLSFDLLLRRCSLCDPHHRFERLLVGQFGDDGERLA